MTRWRSLALALIALLVLAACGKPSAPPPKDLTIQFTADVRGRLVPCGCFTGQLGGLTRIATLFAENAGPNPLRVDVGDAIEGTADYQQIQYGYILKAFAQLGYAAANIGHREAALPLEQLRAIRSQSPVPLISANLLDAATRQPVFETHRMVGRVAVVGLVDPRGLTDSLGAGLVVEKMETTLSNLLPKLKGQADFIVLLAFTDEATLHALAREFYELDVILGGKVTQPAQQLERENRSVILYTTNQSRAVGTLALRLLAPHRVEPERGEITLVSDRIPEDRAIRQLASDYRDEIRRTKLNVDDPTKLAAELVPGVKQAASFAGSASCIDCHTGAAEVWQKSGHAHAFQALLTVKADADPNCIACHTVGFGSPSGYLREFGTKKLTDVGCESCHGPGSLHVEQRRSDAPATDHFRTLGAGDCQKCHHGEFSRPFDFDKFWPQVQHNREAAASLLKPIPPLPISKPQTKERR